MDKQIEIDTEFEIHNSVLKLRLIVNYKLDRDGLVSYSLLIAGDAYSDRRRQWIALNDKALDGICSRHFRLLEAKIQDEERKKEDMYKYYMDARCA